MFGNALPTLHRIHGLKAFGQRFDISGPTQGQGFASQSSSRAASPNQWTYSRSITLDTTASGAHVTEDVEKYPLAVLWTGATCTSFTLSDAYS